MAGSEKELDALIDDLKQKMNIKWGRRLPACAEGQPWVQYLGKQWKRTDNGFLLRTTPNYIDDIAQLLRLQNAKAAPTPCGISEADKRRGMAGPTTR
eukprot:12347813-Heterocapsa_arctica.AAC.1